MSINKLQIYLTMLGGIAPALLNLLSVLLAATSSESVGTGEALMMLALFYIAIDIGNFGASRLMLINDFSVNVHAIKFLDYVSGLISSASFFLISFIVVQLKLVSLDFSLLLLSVFPFLYCFSHSALGILRTSSNNGVIALVLVFCSVIRLLITYLHVANYFNVADFLLGLFFVEGLQGLLFLACVKLIPSAKSDGAYNGSVTQVITRNRKMINASWFSNILNGFIKHSDVFLIGVLAGPSSVLIYRPIKSAINLVFNTASSLSIVYVSGSKLNQIQDLAKSRLFLACLLLFVLLVSLLSFSADVYWHLFLPNVVLENAFLIVFMSGIACLLVFINRFLHSILILLEANSTLILSSLIDASVLYLLFFICVPMIGVSGAVFSILMSSITFFAYSLFQIRQRIKIKENLI